MSERRYHVSYAFESHPEGIEKKDVRLGWGATDAFLFVSIIADEGGNRTVEFISGDGKTKERLSGGEMAMVGGALLAELSLGDCELDPPLRDIFARAFEALQGELARRKEEVH